MPRRAVMSSRTERSHDARSMRVPRKLHGIRRHARPATVARETCADPAIGRHAARAAASSVYAKSSTAASRSADGAVAPAAIVHENTSAAARTMSGLMACLLDRRFATMSVTTCGTESIGQPPAEGTIRHALDLPKPLARTGPRGVIWRVRGAWGDACSGARARPAEPANGEPANAVFALDRFPAPVTLRAGRPSGGKGSAG